MAAFGFHLAGKVSVSSPPAGIAFLVVKVSTALVCSPTILLSDTNEVAKLRRTTHL